MSQAQSIIQNPLLKSGADNGALDGTNDVQMVPAMPAKSSGLREIDFAQVFNTTAGNITVQLFIQNEDGTQTQVREKTISAKDYHSFTDLPPLGPGQRLVGKLSGSGTPNWFAKYDRKVGN